nr:hypothetical protein [Tanacetum cinerariifolium]
MMSFISAVVTSRYPTTNNQLRNLSNLRQQATINDGRVTLHPVQGRQISFAIGVQVIPSSEQSNVVNHLETEITSDSNIIPYSQYVTGSQHAVVQNSNSSAQQDALILYLERYKEQVKVLKEGKNVEIIRRDYFSDSHEQNAEIDRLKQTLSKQLQEKESLIKTVTILKNEFKKEETRNIDRKIALEKKIKLLDNIVYKRDQSAQTIHMLTKPRFLYDHSTKQAL